MYTSDKGPRRHTDKVGAQPSLQNLVEKLGAKLLRRCLVDAVMDLPLVKLAKTQKSNQNAIGKSRKNNDRGTEGVSTCRVGCAPVQ